MLSEALDSMFRFIKSPGRETRNRVNELLKAFHTDTTDRGDLFTILQNNPQMIVYQIIWSLEASLIKSLKWKNASPSILRPDFMDALSDSERQYLGEKRSWPSANLLETETALTTLKELANSREKELEPHFVLMSSDMITLYLGFDMVSFASQLGARLALTLHAQTVSLIQARDGHRQAPMDGFEIEYLAKTMQQVRCRPNGSVLRG